MQHELKDKISSAVQEWIEPNNIDRSAEKLSVKTGVSTSYLSHIKRGLYKVGNTEISDATFMKVALGLGLKINNEVHWETKNFIFAQKVCRRAQQDSKTILLDSERSGLGKTYALEHYATYNDRVLYLKCTSSMTSKDVLNEFIEKLHITEKLTGMKSKLDAIRRKIYAHDNYLIIIDEAEKVKSTVYDLIKEIIDFTYRRCAVIVSGLGLIAKIKKLSDKNKEGFPQLSRRLSIKCMMIAIENTEMIDILEKEGITSASAHKWFIRNIQDYQAFTEYVQDVKMVAAKENKPVDGELLTRVFGIN
jgi:DNA transposition AAA+ family ATPase